MKCLLSASRRGNSCAVCDSKPKWDLVLRTRRFTGKHQTNLGGVESLRCTVMPRKNAPFKQRCHVWWCQTQTFLLYVNKYRLSRTNWHAGQSFLAMLVEIASTFLQNVQKQIKILYLLLSCFAVTRLSHGVHGQTVILPFGMCLHTVTVISCDTVHLVDMCRVTQAANILNAYEIRSKINQFLLFT